MTSQETARAECPVRTLILITADETANIEGWNLWLAENGYRDLYARFQDERADLIARQEVERAELQSQWRNTGRRTDRTAQHNKMLSDNSAARSLQTLRAGLKGRKTNSEVQRPENMMKSDSQAPPPDSQFEQTMETGARGRDSAAHANQKTPRQTEKENVVVKGRRAAEKRLLQKQSIAHAQARKALSSIREERPTNVSRKEPDRER